MKAEYEYSASEVLAIVSAVHGAKYPPPDGMAWSPSFGTYGSQAVMIEAVDKEPEGGAG